MNDERASEWADETLRWDEMKSAIDRAVDSLPEQCRLIFTLSRRDRLTTGQIARTLQLSVKTVETQMGRALKALRTRLGAHGRLAGPAPGPSAGLRPNLDKDC